MENCSVTDEDGFGADRGNWKDDIGPPSFADARVVEPGWLENVVQNVKRLTFNQGQSKDPAVLKFTSAANERQHTCRS